MSVIKVIEVMANSRESWEDAAQNAVAEASETLNNIKSVYIKDHSAIVENNKITEYRVTAKVSFEIDHAMHHSENEKTKERETAESR